MRTMTSRTTAEHSDRAATAKPDRDSGRGGAPLGSADRDIDVIENQVQEIETGVIVLGVLSACGLVSLIAWLAI